MLLSLCLLLNAVPNPEAADRLKSPELDKQRAFNLAWPSDSLVLRILGTPSPEKSSRGPFNVPASDCRTRTKFLRPRCRGPGTGSWEAKKLCGNVPRPQSFNGQPGNPSKS